MKYLIMSLILLINCFAVFAQSTFKGVVTDAADDKPVPYVSIGVINKADGTVSNAGGEFKLDVASDVAESDTIKFSSIGYQNVAFLVGDLKQKAKEGPLQINLSKVIVALNPVVVNAKHAVSKIVGYEINSKLFGVGFGTNSIGSQGGVRLAIKHPNTNIGSLSFFIIQNSFQSLTFRLNIYEMKDGKPGDNILTENVIFKIGDKQTGTINVDLSRYNIYVNNDVLMAVEWISATPATNGTLDIAATMFGHTYFRQASQYYWIKKGTGVGLSARIYY